MYNTITLRPLTPTHYAMLYPQNGDRIVAVDFVTSVRPVYKLAYNTLCIVQKANEQSAYVTSYHVYILKKINKNKK